MSTSYTKKQLEDIVAGLNVKLDAMQKSLSGLEGLPGKVEGLETLLKEANEKRAELANSLEAMNKDMQAMKLKLNNLEQHNRSWSIRVHGIQLCEEEEIDSRTVKERIYDSVIRPILDGAVEMGELPVLPSASELLEHAHVLPTRDRSKPKPIICRFYCREIRGLVFKHKKAFAPREAASTPSRDRPGHYKFPFFEDLTKVNFSKMRAIAAHPRVEACWSSGGQLKFKFKDSVTVNRVANVLDTVEDIFAKI